MSQIALQMEHISKAYREGFVAIKDASLTVKKGQIHGLLGENGAGKSTFVKLLSGVLPPDSGTVLLEGQPFSAPSPADAARQGVIRLQSRPDLVPSLTVAENIVLGDRDAGFLANRTRAVEVTEKLIRKFGIELDPNALAAHLNEEDTLETELLKAVHHGVKLLIIDEPSTHVSMGQIEYLFEMLHRLQRTGITILYITNHVEEALHVCDTITVMTDGTTGDTLDAKTAGVAQLKMLMTSGAPHRRPVKPDLELGETVLRVQDLATFHQVGQPALDDLDFTIRAGEILAVVGNADSGARQLCEAIAGLQRIVGGKIELFDEDITKDGVAGTRSLGVSFLISAPGRLGVASSLSIQENLLPYQYANPAYLHEGLLDDEKLQQLARKLVQEYDIDCGSVDDLAGTLSAASAQKLMFARECSNEPVLLIAYRPTAGTSEANAALLRRKLVQLQQEGTAVLLVPTDAEEYQQLADSTLVLHEGRASAHCTGLLALDELDAYATGRKQMTQEEMEAKRP